MQPLNCTRRPRLVRGIKLGEAALEEGRELVGVDGSFDAFLETFRKECGQDVFTLSLRPKDKREIGRRL